MHWQHWGGRIPNFRQIIHCSAFKVRESKLTPRFLGQNTGQWLLLQVQLTPGSSKPKWVIVSTKGLVLNQGKCKWKHGFVLMPGCFKSRALSEISSFSAHENVAKFVLEVSLLCNTWDITRGPQCNRKPAVVSLQQVSNKQYTSKE